MSLLLQLMPRKLIQELFIQLGSYIRMIAAGLIFFSPLHKKAHYRRRLTAALLICLAVCAISAYLRFLSDHVLIHFATQLICFAAPFLIIMLTRCVLTALSIIPASLPGILRQGFPAPVRGII